MYTKLPVPPSNKGGLGPEAGRNGQGTASRTGRPGRKGFAFLTPMVPDSPGSTPSSGEHSFQRHRICALPQVHTGAQEGTGALSSHFPRDMAFPILCRETEWCAQGTV